MHIGLHLTSLPSLDVKRISTVLFLLSSHQVKRLPDEPAPIQYVLLQDFPLLLMWKF
jgi:hypothetical protein